MEPSGSWYCCFWRLLFASSTWGLNATKQQLSFIWRTISSSAVVSNTWPARLRSNYNQWGDTKTKQKVVQVYIAWDLFLNLLIQCPNLQMRRDISASNVHPDHRVRQCKSFVYRNRMGHSIAAIKNYACRAARGI